MGKRQKHYSAWDTVFYLHTREETLRWLKRNRREPVQSRFGRFAEDHKFLGGFVPFALFLAVILLGFYVEDAIWDPDNVPGRPSMMNFMVSTGGLFWMVWYLQVRHPKKFSHTRVVIAHERKAAIDRMLRAPDADPTELLEMVAKRRDWWRQRLSKKRASGMGRYFCMNTLAMYFVLAALGLIVVKTVDPSGPGSVPSLLLQVSIFGGAIYAYISVRRFNRRLSRRLHNQQCPDCGYDATALPPAFTQENLKHLGPAQCSECGSPWPLVPPPAADTVQQPHGKDLLSR